MTGLSGVASTGVASMTMVALASRALTGNTVFIVVSLLRGSVVIRCLGRFGRMANLADRLHDRFFVEDAVQPTFAENLRLGLLDCVKCSIGKPPLGKHLEGDGEPDSQMAHEE